MAQEFFNGEVVKVSVDYAQRYIDAGARQVLGAGGRYIVGDVQEQVPDGFVAFDITTFTPELWNNLYPKTQE